jgi:hypothetical protein
LINPLSKAPRFLGGLLKVLLYSGGRILAFAAYMTLSKSWLEGEKHAILSFKGVTFVAGSVDLFFGVR